MNKKIFICFFSILFVIIGFSIPAFSQEAITITTYYPSPYGVYSKLRLYPQGGANPDGTACSAVSEGGTLLYYPNSIYFCNGTIWTQLSSGPSWWAGDGANNIYNTDTTGNVAIGSGSTLYSGASLSTGAKLNVWQPGGAGAGNYIAGEFDAASTAAAYATTQNAVGLNVNANGFGGATGLSANVVSHGSADGIDSIANLDTMGAPWGAIQAANGIFAYGLGNAMPNSRVRGIYARAMGGDVENDGVYSEAESDVSNGVTYGVRTQAWGQGMGNQAYYGVYAMAKGSGNGPNYGIYGDTDGIGTGPRWAGYFDRGNVHITNNLSLGTMDTTNLLNVFGGMAVGSGYVTTPAPSDGAIIQGQVGIGINTPLAALHVEDRSANQVIIQAGDSRSNAAMSFVTGLGPSKAVFGMGGAWDPDVNAVIIRNAGPVTGPFYFENNSNNRLVTIDAVGNANFAGSGTYVGTWISSDARWKRNIAPLEGSLRKILTLQGVSYYWNIKDNPKKSFPEGKQIGIIAQDMEKVIPELVNTDKEGYKSISYEKLTAVLIEAVKEQQKQIDELKKEVKALEAKNK